MRVSSKTISFFRRRKSVLFAGLGFRSASYYVNKVRTMDWLKNDDTSLMAESRRGHFLVFYNQQPLLKKKADVFGFSMHFVAHNKLQSVCKELSMAFDADAMALIDIVPIQNRGFEDGETEYVPVFAIGLRPPEREEEIPTDFEKTLTDSLQGDLVDLREAIITAGSVNEAHSISKGQVLLRWNRVFRFCPKCGDRVIMKVSKALAFCNHCSQQYHPPVSPVAICLISDEKKENCLLIRLPRSRRGVFTAVAGFSEPGESLEDTARREIAEEVGMDVINISYASASQCWPFPNGSMMFACHAIASRSQEPEIDHSELEDAGWFNRDEVEWAWKNSVVDPLCSSTGGKRFAYTPPSGTMAHELVRQWLCDKR